MAKPGKRAKTHLNIPMCLAGVLFCMTLFSFHLSSGVVARYSATASGSDSARVITFKDIQLEVETGANEYIYPGAKLKLNPKVSFGGSESATYVFLEVSGIQPGNVTGVKPLPISMTEWQVDSSHWALVTAEGTEHIYCYKYNGSDLLLPPNTEIGWTYLFATDKDTSEVRWDATVEQINDSSLSVEFRAHAVQGNGFDTALAAWESLDAKENP